MKVLIPTAALALGAFAWAARAKEVASPPARPAARKAEAAPAPAPEPVAAEVEKADPEAAPARPAIAPAPAVPARPAADPVWALDLRRELELSDEQKVWVSEILRERARVVAAYELEVKNRGWFRLEEFAWRIGEIRETTYDRIEAALDPERARTFAALRPGLIHKDFLTIAIPEEHVVSLD